MSAAPGKKSQDAESEIWNAISAFERILEIMPDDRTSLDTLVHAYTQLGDNTRARDYLVRLAKVVESERDIEAVSSIVDQLRAYSDQEPEIQGLMERLENLLVETIQPIGAEKKIAPPRGVVKGSLPRKINISDELSLAWDLLQAGELTQEQYAEVVQDLTDISSNAADKGAVSMLHVIGNRGFGNIDRIMVFASLKGETPIINLSSFEINAEATALLPMEYMTRQGVLPFDLLGPDALVVIQNPYDQELRRHVEEAIGRHCHFFLTPPQEFISAIARVVKREVEAAAKAASAAKRVEGT